MRNQGFSMIELIFVVAIIGLVVMIGAPRLRDSIEKQNRRSMRAALVTYVAVARNTAVARGCRSSVHFVSGGNSRVWVTACSVKQGAALTARDTVVGPEWTEAQWNHRFVAGRDSINFDSRGLRQNLVRTKITIRNKQDQDRDSVVVNEVGKVTYP
jgi:prepilin-type N-terminal cleavage/methylation domain-containing protein